MANQVTGLVATAVSTSEIDLYWDDVAALTGEVYDVERDGVIVGNDYAGAHTVGSPYADTGLSPGTAYTYRVRAVNGSPSVSGLVARYDFSDITTLWKDTARTSAVTADGDIVKGVTDLSGAANHLSEATNGPTYKTAILNGLSIARFDGTNDVLTSTFSGPAAWTLFVVTRTANATTDTFMLDFRTDHNLAILSGYVDNKYEWWEGGSRAQAGTNSTTNFNDIVVRRPAHSGIYQTYLDGVAGGTESTIASLGNTLTMGANPGGNYAGDMAELLLYNTMLSASDTNIVGSYLAGKWGLSWTTVP